MLGRLVTLQNCDFATKEWLENSARRLIKAKQRLESLLVKYEPLPPMPPTPTITPSGVASKPLAECDLRALMMRIAALKQRLSKLRPALVTTLDV